MQKAAETGYASLFCITGFVYGAHQLGRLGTLLLPAASKAAALSTQLAELHGTLLPCAAAPFGLFSLAAYSTNEVKEPAFLLFAFWGLSVGLAPLFPSRIGCWVDQVGKGVTASWLAYAAVAERGARPDQENHGRIQAAFFSIAHLTAMDLFTSLPGSQWIEPIAALSGIAVSLF